MLTGFTHVHNPITKGQPFVEAILQVLPFVCEVIVVDMGSDDNTIDVIEHMSRTYNIKLLRYDGRDNVMTYQQLAKTKSILHFYPDEIYPKPLLNELYDLVVNCNTINISVLRIVVEQNFQRVRWYPEYVHRVFRRGNIKIDGVTTNKAHLRRMHYVDERLGYLWAFQNCFRDNFLKSIDDYEWVKIVQEHFLKEQNITIDRIRKAKHWRWKSTPLQLPPIIKSHIGRTHYSPYLNFGG